MLEGNDRFRWVEGRFLALDIIKDDWVAKLRKVIANRCVEFQFPLIEQFECSDLQQFQIVENFISVKRQQIDKPQ